MAEKRKFSSSICVKIDAKTLFKIELFPAEQWAESAQAAEDLSECYRLRVNRRWHDEPDGRHVYLDVVQVAALAAALAAGQDIALPPEPVLPRGSAVSAYIRRTADGAREPVGTHTVTEPFRGYDGRWYVGVISYGKGTLMVPVEDVKIKGRRA